MNNNVQEFLENIGLRVRSVSAGRGEVNVYCPFHDEKEASMFINTKKGVFHCFGACGGKGSISTLFYNIDKKQYKGWLYQLSMITYLPLTSTVESDTIKVEEMKVDALPYCDSTMSYMEERHISQATIEKFNLRYHKGYDAIIIPLYEHDGETQMGYVRRNMRGTRYVNSPNLEVDTTLYPLHRVSTQGVNKLLLVEGLFDAIRAHQEGYQNTVTCFGGELTQNQIRELGKLTRNIVVAPDKDKQGKRIAKKNIKMLQKYGFSIELMILDGHAKDLAEMERIDRLPITSYYQMLFSRKRLDDLW